MSAIIGLFQLDGRLHDPAVLRDMIAPVAHRRPEGATPWIMSTTAMPAGMAVLESTAFIVIDRDQPGDALRIVADIRIDNRAELMGLLGLDARALSDAELVTEAYRRWGTGCVERLHGDFAFILWDPRERLLLAARDRVGVKPLYYMHEHGCFAAATDMQALRAMPGNTSEMSPEWIAYYLAGSFDDIAITPYDRIRRLPPATYAVIDAEGRMTQHRYAELDPHRELPPAADDREYIDAFRELFADAVNARMRTPHRVGAALSGGLDSTSVACMARALDRSGLPPATFSAVFDDVPASNERAFIETALAGGGFEPHFIRGDHIAPLDDLERMHRTLGQPFFSPNLFLHWRMFSAARDAGADVWLDGLDGDTTVSHGFGYLPELARSGHWLALQREMSAVAARSGRSLWDVFRRHVLGALVFEPRDVRLRRSADYNPWSAVPVTSVLASSSGAAEHMRSIAANPRPARTQREEHHRRLSWPLHAFVLETLDAAAGRFGIEPRYPFYDWRLMEFCLALPPRLKLHDGWGRYVLREAMSGIVPDEIRRRPRKGNPGPNFVRSFRLHEAGRLQAMLAHPGRLAAYVEIPRLAAQYERFMADAASEGEIMSLWKCLTLWLWAEPDALGLAGEARFPRL